MHPTQSDKQSSALTNQQESSQLPTPQHPAPDCYSLHTGLTARAIRIAVPRASLFAAPAAAAPRLLARPAVENTADRYR